MNLSEFMLLKQTRGNKNFSHVIHVIRLSKLTYLCQPERVASPWRGDFGILHRSTFVPSKTGKFQLACDLELLNLLLIILILLITMWGSENIRLTFLL